MWRNLFEMSCMQNNEEVVLHSEDRIVPEDFRTSDSYHAMLRSLGLRWDSRFYSPRLMFSREVVPDMESGLDTEYRGSVYGEDRSDTTRAIDELTKMYTFFEFYSNVLVQDPGSILVDWVASNFYDCMSGGSSHISLAMARRLIKSQGVSLDLDVYPHHKSEKWSTLRDFLEEIKDVPDVDDKLLPANIKSLTKGRP